MIKVNLLKTRIIDPAAAGTAAEVSAAQTAGSRAALVKIFMLIIFAAALMIYENQAINTLNLQSAQAKSKVEELQNAANAKVAELETVKDVEGQARELEDKLKILKFLSKLRLREVKTLDFMQSSIPEQVWLRNLTFTTDNESVEGGNFVFIGRAVTTDDLTEFAKRLDESAYLDEVIVIRNQEVVVDPRTTNREFQMTAKVEQN